MPSLRYLSFALCLCWAAPFSLAGQSFDWAKLSAPLQQQLAEAPTGPWQVQILLEDRIDPQALEQRFRQARLPVKERSARLIQALQDKAEATQPAFLERLYRLPGLQAASVKAFWVTNLVFCEIGPEGLAALSQDEAVAWLDLNWDIALPDAVAAPAAPPPPNGISAGLQAIGAPFLWALGYTGYGRKVLVVDTGQDIDHPAISHNFAYHQRPMREAWANPGQPYYCGHHGTHVSGIIAGIDRLARDTIGPAFGAMWQGSSFSDCQASDGKALQYAQLFQWALDPDGDPATIDDRPDVINNSWSRKNPLPSDCSDPVHRAIADAVYAAGIALVFSAGNEGPAPSSIGNPSMDNWGLVRMFSVAAVDEQADGWPVADFSSRGPSLCGGPASLRIKPEVAAPGVRVRSAVPGGGYAALDGTSMAAPYVSGGLLLLKEAFPYLSGEELMLALYYTCTDLGAPGEDNDYGMGLINLPAAYQYLRQQGHSPLPPIRAHNDISLLAIEQLPYHCGPLFTAAIWVENNGTDSLRSLDVAYDIAGIAGEFTWQGSLAPAERRLISLPALPLPEGRHELSVEIVLANGSPDLRYLDNQLKQSVTILDWPELTVAVEGSAPICEGGTASLRAQVAGDATLAWYDAPQGGNLLAEGPLLTLTPTTVGARAYLAANMTSVLPGADAEQGHTELSDAVQGLIFDVHHACRLEAVSVYAEEPGGRLLRLLGPDGSDRSLMVQLPATGEQRVELGFDLLPGTGYRLQLQAGKPLRVSTGDWAYPYELPALLSIQSATAGEDTYPYFHNWEITYPYLCGRQEVEVPVSSAQSSGPIGIIASTTLLDLGQGNDRVEFEAQAPGAQAWQWDFGDGQSSGLANPIKQYTEAGEYPVSLSVQTSQGCTESALIWITVEDSRPPASTEEVAQQERLQLFPNPAGEELYFKLTGLGSQEVGLRLMDVLGRPLLAEQRRVLSGQAQPISLAGLPSGAYFLVFEFGGTFLTRRFIKQ